MPGWSSKDTKVAGLYPLKGERLTLTVLLCAMEQNDYARGLLRGLEKIAGAVDLTGAVTTSLRIADVIMDGIDDIFDTEACSLVAGLRRELSIGRGIGSPSYFVIAAEPELSGSDLWVDSGRLKRGASSGGATPFTTSDYSLVSVRAASSRQDLDLLPFQSLWKQASREAQRSVDDKTWAERGRAALYTLAEAVYDSDDLTEGQKDTVIQAFEERAVMLRDRARQKQNLGPAPEVDVSRPRSESILGL